MTRRCLLASLLVALAAPSLPAQEGRRLLEAGPSAVENPLKGLVPYSGDWKGVFPHSLEFNYLPLSALVAGPETYDWKPLERLLDECAGRGHHTVLRVYAEYPGKTDGLPPFLLRDGLKVFKYRDETSKPPEDNVTPDYADARLRKVLAGFVAALGKKYDGDPRLGYVTAGLLGQWGEWHTYPRDDLFASRAVQTEVMDAYEAAFKVTPVLLRYPAGPKNEAMAANDARPFGYHDDSFAWGTLDTGRPDDSWFYLSLLKAAGPAAQAKWKTQPIGGEVRPEVWGKIFDAKPGVKGAQDFRQCVEQTHATWLMETGLFEKKADPVRRKRAEEEVRRMGYDFHAVAVTLGQVAGGKLPVAVEVENRGVAPFYAPWPVEYGLIAGGKVVKTFPGTGKLTGLLPGDKPRVWADSLDVSGLAAGAYRVAVRVPNPLPKGRAVGFANAAQDADAPGWLTLGDFEAK